MAKKIQKGKMKKKLGLLFIQKGKFLTCEEYTALAKEQPILGSSVRRLFGSYAKMLSSLKEDEALVALVEQSAELQKPKAKPVAEAKPAAKAKPVAEAKPTAKAKLVPKFGASKSEK